jgi:hypothetical protein
VSLITTSQLRWDVVKKVVDNCRADCTPPPKMLGGLILRPGGAVGDFFRGVPTQPIAPGHPPPPVPKYANVQSGTKIRSHLMSSLVHEIARLRDYLTQLFRYYFIPEYNKGAVFLPISHLRPSPTSCYRVCRHRRRRQLEHVDDNVDNLTLCLPNSIFVIKLIRIRRAVAIDRDKGRTRS